MECVRCDEIKHDPRPAKMNAIKTKIHAQQKTKKIETTQLADRRSVIAAHHF